MSIVYYCNKKLLRAAARAYAQEHRQPATVPFCMDTEYTWEALVALRRTHDDWLADCEFLTPGSTAWFVPYCAWCYEVRWSWGDENEHDECDARIHYHSEAGKIEQAELLTSTVIPHAPAVVIAQIMEFL